MISACSNCGKALNLTENQQVKIDNALASLPPGKVLKFNCPHCHKPIEIQREIPDAARQTVQIDIPETRLPAPPRPPDRSWLKREDSGSSDVLEDVPQVMILINNETIQSETVRFFDKMGYKAVIPRSADEAIERIRFTNFSVVVLHSCFEGSLASSTIHAYLQNMGMPQRRYIYYVLIGPEFHTLYCLEALSNSANLVINEADISSFPLVLKKGLRDYEELFGPYLAALEVMGKK